MQLFVREFAQPESMLASGSTFLLDFHRRISRRDHIGRNQPADQLQKAHAVTTLDQSVLCCIMHPRGQTSEVKPEFGMA